MIISCGRRRRRKAERPTEILDAAFEEFALNGFARTRLDDVAARAGITKGTIYLYFGSKEDLFIAALKQVMLPIFENITSLMREPKGSASTILRRHLAFVAARMVEDRPGREVIRILMAEGERFPQVADRWHAEVIAPSLTALRDVLLYGIETGEFRASAVQDFPHLIISPVMLASNWISIFGTRQPLDVARFFDTAFDVFTLGLTVRAQPVG